MIYRILAALALGLLLWPGAPSAQAVDAAGVKRVVEEYLKPNTTEERRTQIVAALSGAKTADIAGPLKSAIRRDKDRLLALQLGLRRQVPGLSSAALTQLHTHPAEVAALVLATFDKGAAKSLITKWRESDRAGGTFSAVKAALLKYGIEPEVMDELQKIIADERADDEVKTAALSILAWQIGEPQLTAEVLQAEWKERRKSLATLAKRNAGEGLDLLMVGTPKALRTTMRGANYLVEPRGEVRAQPLSKDFINADFTITGWLYFDSDVPDAFVQLPRVTGPSAGTSLGVMVEGGNWTITIASGDPLVAPCTVKTWVSFRFSFKDVKGSKPTHSYVLEGKTLLKDSPVSGSIPETISLLPKAGNLIVGPMYLTRP